MDPQHDSLLGEVQKTATLAGTLLGIIVSAIAIVRGAPAALRKVRKWRRERLDRQRSARRLDIRDVFDQHIKPAMDQQDKRFEHRLNAIERRLDEMGGKHERDHNSLFEMMAGLERRQTRAEFGQ